MKSIFDIRAEEGDRVMKAKLDENPFHKQAQIHKKEMWAWRIASWILGIILIISIISWCPPCS